MLLFIKSKLLLVVLSIGCICFSQQYPVKHIDLDKGLASNSSRVTFKDSRGFFWIGTRGGVSLMANDVVIKNYTVNDGLAGNHCWDIIEDDYGNMWFGTYNTGVTKYDGKTFTIYNKDSGLIDNRIRKLFYYNNHVFVGTDRGLSVINVNTNKIKSFAKTFENEGSNKSHTQIQSIFEYKGKVYINEYRAGLFEVDYLPSKISLHPIRDYSYIMASKIIDGILYSGLDGFFSKMEIESYMNDSIPENIIASKSVFWDFEKGNDNSVYAAAWGVRAENGGVYELIDNELVCVNEKLGITSKSILDLYYDSDFKKLYVTSLDKGLFIVDVSEELTFINHKDKILDYIQSKDNYEFLLLENELQILKNKKTVRIISKYELQTYINDFAKNINELLGHTKQLNKDIYNVLSLQSIHRDSDNILLSVNTGVFTINSNGMILDYFPVQNEMFSIQNNDELIVPIPYYRVVIFENENYNTYQLFETSEPQNPKNVEQLISVNNTTYFLDRTNGMYQYKNREMCKLWSKRELKTMCYYKDTLYMANNNGVIYKASTQPKFELVDSISNKFYKGKTINHIIVNNNKLFFATDKGLNIIEGKKHQFLDDKSGLSSKNIGFLKIYNDTFYVGASNLLNKIAVNSPSSTRVMSPQLFINDIKVNYKEYSTEKSWGYVTNKEISLPYNQNIISLNFNTTGYKHSEKLNYSYSIEGLDEYWSKPTQETSFVIPYLPDGKFTVNIKVEDESTGVTQVYSPIAIVIKPPFWKTIWFMVFVAIVLITLVLGYIKIRTVQIRKKEIEKSRMHKRIVDNKLEALRSQMNPHFTFNAMNSIQNFIVDADIESAMLYLSEFSKLIRTTLEYSTTSKITISEEIAYLKNYISLENMRFGNKVKVNFSIDKSIDVDEVEIIPMTLQPFVENVFEHAFNTQTDKPKLDISFSLLNDNKLKVIVEDNGSGYAFNPSNKMGQSKGVALVKERLKLAQGSNDSISISSSDNGTIITIYMVI